MLHTNEGMTIDKFVVFIRKMLLIHLCIRKSTAHKI